MFNRIRTWLGTEDAAARLETIARAQSKLSLRLDDLVDQIEANHRALLERLDAPDVGELLDALDRLDDARLSLRVDQAELADGLGGVGARVERFVSRLGLVRHASSGVAPNGRWFRVVGTQDNPALADGVVARVVRSAATRGGELVREGEVIINRHGSAP